jgi:hypothetical protein
VYRKVIEFVRQKSINQAIRLSPILGRKFPDFFSHQLRNPVFIIGCARSGTTMLASLLDCHRDAANWSEANHIWDPGWYPWKPSYFDKVPMEFDPVSFTKRWWSDAEPRQKEIKAIFGAHQWLRQKSYFVNKSPFNTFRIPLLHSIFPGAKFIHLVRDGRAVVFSHAKKLSNEQKLQEWPEPYRTKFSQSFEELLLWLSNFWKTSAKEVERQDQTLKLSDSGLFLEVSYEQLCTDKEASLAGICKFLGLENSRFTSRVQLKKLMNQNQKWQKALSSEIAGKMSDNMEPMLKRKGYL